MAFFFLKKFDLLSDCEQYRQNELFRNSVTSTNNVTCQNCVIKDHKMKVQYIGCSNADCYTGKESCPKKYKVPICLSEKKNSGKIRLFERGKHLSKLNSLTHWGYYF